MLYEEYKFLKKLNKHQTLKPGEFTAEEFTHIRELYKRGYIDKENGHISFNPKGRKEFNEYAWKLRQERLKNFFK